MAKQILTDRYVEGLRPKIDEKTAKPVPYEVSDADCTGLILRVQASGKKHWYQLLWSTNKEGKRVRYRWKIGEFPDYCLFAKTPSNAEDRQRDVRAAARRLKVQAETTHLQEAKQEAKAKEEADTVATLSAFLDGPYLEYAKENHKGNCEAAVRHLKTSFVDLLDKRMDAITGWDIKVWMKNASKTLSAGTIHRRLGSLSGVFSHAVRKGIITAPHILTKTEREKAEIKIPKPEAKRPRFLSKDEEQALRDSLAARDQKLKAARSRYIQHCEAREGLTAPAPIAGAFADHITPLTLLALNTGIRRGGLLNLRWSDIETGQIFIRKEHDKGGKGYHVSLSNEAKQVLRLWQKQTGGKGDDLVFTYKGKPVKSIKTAWAGVIKEAGIKNFRFHDCRHSFASKLVQAGVPLYTVSQLLGHSSLDMTMKYAHLSPDHMKDALAALDGAS